MIVASLMNRKPLMVQATLLRLLLVAASCLTASCVHTYEVGYTRDRGDGESAVTAEEMTRCVLAERVTTVRAAGEPVDGNVIAMSGDSVQLVIWDSVRIRIPARTIESIKIEGSAAGPILGLIGGGMLGALISGAVSGGSAGEGYVTTKPAVIAAAALTGGLLGLFVGSNVTASRRYLLSQGTTDPRTGILTDTVNLWVDSILEETEFSVSIPWEGGSLQLPRWRITVESSPEGVEIAAPRKLMFDKFGRPRRVPSHLRSRK